jgi:hypothetical protein
VIDGETDSEIFFGRVRYEMRVLFWLLVSVLFPPALLVWTGLLLFQIAAGAAAGWREADR